MKLKNKKIAFFGTPFFAKELLEFLLNEEIPISLVVTQSPKPSGRKQHVTKSEVGKFAQEKGINLLECVKISPKQIPFFIRQNLDVIITASYGTILPKELLELPKNGSLNVHPSLLPKYRGPSPIQYALLNGEEKTGTTIMMMDEKMDAGDILSQSEVVIEQNENYITLEKKLLEKSKALLAKTLTAWLDNTLTPKKQAHSEATFSRIIKKDDGLIDWQSNTLEEIRNKYRAYFRWPRIFSFFDDRGTRKKIIFHEIEVAETTNLEEEIVPGKVFILNEYVAIKTKTGAILPKKIQMEGKAPLPIKQFILGKKNFIGSSLG